MYLITFHTFSLTSRPQSTPAITTLIDYILQKISGDQQFHHTITTLLSQSTDALSHVGLIIGERVYNMPPQVMPPLYDMLLNEIESASDDVRAYYLLQMWY